MNIRVIKNGQAILDNSFVIFSGFAAEGWLFDSSPGKHLLFFSRPKKINIWDATGTWAIDKSSQDAEGATKLNVYGVRCLAFVTKTTYNTKILHMCADFKQVTPPLA